MAGVAGLLKEGTKHLSGLEEAILKNIEACKALSTLTRTSLGPNGMNKMIITTHGKVYVSSDCAVILKELEVEHPAAKMIAMAAEMQENEMGDGTNFVVVLSGELLLQAASLLKMGLHPSQVVTGYKKAGKLASEILETLIIGNVPLPITKEVLEPIVKTSVASKQYAHAELLSRLVSDASLHVMPSNPRGFNVDSIRVLKVMGGTVSDSSIIPGFAIKGGVEGSVQSVKDCKVAVFAQAFDLASTETKGTILFQKADELLSYSKGEEDEMETVVKALADLGVACVCAGGSFAPLALHFFEKFDIMAVKLSNKFQVARVCKALHAVPQLNVRAPPVDHLGHAATASVDELGSDKLVIFHRNHPESAERSTIATIVVRGSTNNVMDDVERAIDDGINTVKLVTRDPRFLPGAGATEIEISRQLQLKGETVLGLDQYAIQRFAEALEVIPRTLGENAGASPMHVISALYAAHTAGKPTMGVDIECQDGARTDGCDILDAAEAKICDMYLAKANALRLAVDVVTNILLVDQIIMARASGGPKVPQMGSRDAS